MNRRRFLAGGIGLTAMPPAVAAEGFHVPAESAPHAMTLMQWPVHRGIYPNPVLLRRVQRTIAEIANTIALFEPVAMLAAAEHHDAARRRLSERVMLWDVPTDDLWCRDSGPLFATNGAGGLAVRHIRFNGWGNRQAHGADGEIARRVAERLGVPLLPSGLTGEGGGVDHDGAGLLMAHESSWVAANRNPGLDRTEIGARLCAAYGASEIIWSPGLRGQDVTDYHIDSLARFTAPGRVLINLPHDPDPDDPFHAAARDTHARLGAAGLSIDVIGDPRHPRVRRSDFVASYVNFYLCNGAVIAADFGDRDTDDAARTALGRHFPYREVLMLNVDVLGELGGGIHCATQQVPAT